MENDSYEKSISEKLYGRVPKKVMATDRMAIRVAHTFATKVVGKLVSDAEEHYKEGCTDLQAYNKVYKKYAGTCSDYIIRSSIHKIYSVLGGENVPT